MTCGVQEGRSYRIQTCIRSVQDPNLHVYNHSKPLFCFAFAFSFAFSYLLVVCLSPCTTQQIAIARWRFLASITIRVPETFCSPVSIGASAVATCFPCQELVRSHLRRASSDVILLSRLRCLADWHPKISAARRVHT